MFSICNNDSANLVSGLWHAYTTQRAAYTNGIQRANLEKSTNVNINDDYQDEQ